MIRNHPLIITLEPRPARLGKDGLIFLYNEYLLFKICFRIFNMLPAPIKEYLASKYTTVIKPTKEAIQSIQKN